MADLAHPLPYAVEYGGVTWRLTPAFDNVLRLYTVLDEIASPADQLDLMLHYLLARDDYPLDPELLQSIISAVFIPHKTGDGGKGFDFVQDAPYIYAAFRQAYGVDLFAEQGKLHWWAFCAMLDSLPSDTRFAEIVQIRMKPLPQPTKHNAQDRAQLMKLKRVYALELSAAERQKQMQDGLRKMAVCMLQMAEK